MCTPGEIRQKVLPQAHNSAYFIHQRGTKMYQYLKQHFWWNMMKRELTQYIGKCLVCQQVKTEHQKSVELLRPLPIPEWNGFHYIATPQSEGK